MCVVTDMLKTTAEGNLRDERGRAHKCASVDVDSWHMGSIDRGDRQNGK